MERDLLRITTVADAAVFTLRLDGEVDVSNAPRLIDRFAGIVEARPAQLDVDLSRLARVDSAGLSVFVTAHFQCLDAGIQLRFLCPNPVVGELLATTGLEEILSVSHAQDAVAGI